MTVICIFELFFAAKVLQHVHVFSSSVFFSKLRPLMTKPTKWHVHPAKTQISLVIHPVWSESSPCAQLVTKDPSFLHADSEDSDQTGRMPRLIWVFAGCTCHFVGFVTRWLKFFLPYSLAVSFHFYTFLQPGGQFKQELELLKHKLLIKITLHVTIQIVTTLTAWHLAETACDCFSYQTEATFLSKLQNKLSYL